VKFPLDQISFKSKLPDHVFRHLKGKGAYDGTKNLFKKLEDQNNLVMQLHESKGLSDAFTPAKVRGPAIMDVSTQGKEKMAMAMEFNRS